MINAIIIEDEARAADLLSEMLLEIEPQIQVLEKCSNLPDAIKSIRKYAPDLVFLDVELPVYNGLQLLDFLIAEEITFRIIFTTASNEHAMQAFNMSAVDYVLKPIQFDKLKHAVQKFMDGFSKIEAFPYATLRDNFFNRGSKKIVVAVSNAYEIIKLDDILFIKAEGSYADIQQENGNNLLVSHNLKYYEDIFRDETNFIRIHRSYLVNINYAKKIIRNDGPVLIMENDTELPVANDKIDVILNFFNFNKKN